MNCATLEKAENSFMSAAWDRYERSQDGTAETLIINQYDAIYKDSQLLDEAIGWYYCQSAENATALNQANLELATATCGKETLKITEAAIGLADLWDIAVNAYAEFLVMNGGMK